MYCSFVGGGLSNDNGSGYNSKGDENMFWGKQICSNCKTGKESYELDNYSETCPYIGCWENGKCHFYVPLDNPSKNKIFKGLKNKHIVQPPKNNV